MEPFHIETDCDQGRHFILICGGGGVQEAEPPTGVQGDPTAPWSPSDFDILMVFLTYIFVGNMMKFLKQLFVLYLLFYILYFILLYVIT